MRVRGDEVARAAHDEKTDVSRPEALKSETAAAVEEEVAVVIDPEAANHALLVRMQEIGTELGLKPCQITELTGISHQHQRKLRPTEDGAETRVTLFTVIKWCNGLCESLLGIIAGVVVDVLLPPGHDLAEARARAIKLAQSLSMQIIRAAERRCAARQCAGKGASCQECGEVEETLVSSIDGPAVKHCPHEHDGPIQQPPASGRLRVGVVHLPQGNISQP